jgi:hypothetical protein
MSAYFVVEAPGHFGDRAKVVSNHFLLEDALKVATRGYVVKKGHLQKGEWLSAGEYSDFPTMDGSTLGWSR